MERIAAPTGTNPIYVLTSHWQKTGRTQIKCNLFDSDPVTVILYFATQNNDDVRFATIHDNNIKQLY
jgi:hypothetical protein